MDTIIYLYHSREPRRFIIEKWQEKEYCLIRVGIPELLWKNLKTLEKCDKQSLQLHDKRMDRKARRRKRRKPAMVSKMAQAESVQRCENKEQQEAAVLLQELAELQTALCLLGGNPYWTYCVYEDFLFERIDTKLWRECWRLPGFAEYHETVWVEELLTYATKDAFLILGYAPCIGNILNRHAVKMRSVRWILKPEQYTEAVQQFIDTFYEEFGLVISLQVSEPGEEWVKLRPFSAAPINVLDFTQEEKLSACDVAKGSIWLDMDSLEGKERRMESRCPQIAYFSLKKLWSHLDTIGKNRYNT